jgi:hypothetical protein
MKKVIVMVVGTISVPEDWGKDKIEYHLRKGTIELGDVDADVRDQTCVLVYHDVTDVIVIEGV